MGDCLWKITGGELLSCPFILTTNSTDGIMSNWTKKESFPCGSTAPLITTDLDDSTKETSVTAADSLPVTDTNKVLLTPWKKKKLYNLWVDNVWTQSVNHILTFYITSSGTTVKSIITYDRALWCLHKVKQEVNRTLTCNKKVKTKSTRITALQSYASTNQWSLHACVSRLILNYITYTYV